MIDALAELGVELRRDQPDRAVHLRRLPRADPARDAAPRATSTRSSTVPHQEGRPAQGRSRPRSRSTRPSSEAAEGSGAADEDDGSAGRRVLPVQAVLRRLRQGPHHRHRLRRRHHRADLHLPPAGSPRRCCSASSTAASWSGRSTGRCAGPTRASSSSRPASTTPRPARPSCRRADRREIFGGEQPIGPMYAFVGISGMAKMCSSRGRRADPGRRAGDHGAAAAALAVRPPQAQPVLQDRLRPGDPAALRRVGRARAQGRRRYGAAGGRWPRTPGPSAPRPATLPRTPRPLPYRTLASVARHHRRRTTSRRCASCRDLDPGRPGRLAGRGCGRGWTAPQRWVNTQVPAEQRTLVRDEPDAELLALARRAGPRVAAAAGRGPGATLVAGRADHPRLRRAEGPGRPAAGRQAARRS